MKFGNGGDPCRQDLVNMHIYFELFCALTHLRIRLIFYVHIKASEIRKEDPIIDKYFLWPL